MTAPTMFTQRLLPCLKNRDRNTIAIEHCVENSPQPGKASQAIQSPVNSDMAARLSKD
jgi:hypothetical protein